MNYVNHRSFLPYGRYNSNCDTCVNDPLYNPQQCNIPGPFFCKNPCPLKAFCDPGLANTCESKPLIDPYSPRKAVTTWRINYLVSNVTLGSSGQREAANGDLFLINPWGIVVYNNQLWVSNNTSDCITIYDLYGNKILTTITVRDAAHNSSFPTGLVINCGTGFLVSQGTLSRPANVLVCTEHGTLHGYNPVIDPDDSTVLINTQLGGHVFCYRGLALANDTLYMADFMGGHIDVFDSRFYPLHGFNFIDGDSTDPIPLDFAPNNIVHIGCFLYVIYARKDSDVTVTTFDGPGHGFVSVFNLDGTWVKRFTSRGVLNSPWAMIPAPCECGFPPGSFLIGNNGDGRINVFDCAGRYVGPMLNPAGIPISIDGLWGLAPHYMEFNQIFFASASIELYNGLVGNIIKDQVIYF